MSLCDITLGERIASSYPALKGRATHQPPLCGLDRPQSVGLCHLDGRCLAELGNNHKNVTGGCIDALNKAVFAQTMRATLLAIFTLSCVLVASCSKKSLTAMVATKVAYSHANQVSGGVEMVRRQELGTVSQKTPSRGQAIALDDRKEVRFSQSTDASNPGKIKVTLESTSDGFLPETQVLHFDAGVPNPPAAQFKNGLKAFVTVDTYTE